MSNEVFKTTTAQSVQTDVVNLDQSHYNQQTKLSTLIVPDQHNVKCHAII